MQKKVSSDNIIKTGKIYTDNVILQEKLEDKIENKNERVGLKVRKQYIKKLNLKLKNINNTILIKQKEFNKIEKTQQDKLEKNKEDNIKLKQFHY